MPRIITIPSWAKFELELKSAGGTAAWTEITETNPEYGMMIRSALLAKKGELFEDAINLVVNTAGLAAAQNTALTDARDVVSDDITFTNIAQMQIFNQPGAASDPLGTLANFGQAINAEEAGVPNPLQPGSGNGGELEGAVAQLANAVSLLAREV